MQDVKAYRTLLNLFETSHNDTMKIHNALIYPEDGQQRSPEEEERAAADLGAGHLTGGAFHPGADPQQSKLHATRREIHQYEVVWIPVVDCTVMGTDPIMKQFEAPQSTMPWYTVSHPNQIN
ncbi:hypothetical protein NL676_015106 [Syzygium grande]|nr:hypothetical protein NL676_015106 [Syzygium grande]